jgi:hypothetical protein
LPETTAASPAPKPASAPVATSGRAEQDVATKAMTTTAAKIAAATNLDLIVVAAVDHTTDDR